jgi:NAD-specific glutamate dehydrogenase
VHPQNCVRHDADDPYLVVAADKGTATFSDIANAISADHGYWLGDAFASGGSVGYDHKGMGITAKGAWESVKRHFRAMGRDCQSQDFTCVGIGDMSGDVFGNGMLLSKHTRLLAAFDHRHIFLDPNPDAAATFVERERMFKLPRSSWADYDTKLISKGGGIHPRTAKTIPVSPQVRPVVHSRARHRAGHSGQILHEITEDELSGPLDRRPVDRNDRVRRFGIHTANIRTGHDDRVQGLILRFGIVRGLRLGNLRRARHDGDAQRQGQAYG